MTNPEIGDPITGLAQRIEKHEHDIQNIYGKLMRAFVGSRIVAGNITGVLPPGTVITPTIISMLNQSGGALVDGDVVVLDITQPRTIKTTAIRGDSLVIGVVRDVNSAGTFANGSETPIQIDGYVAELHVTGSVAIGDYLRTSATVKLAESVGNAPTANVFARALSVDAAGSVNAYILAAGTGGGGSTGGGGMGPPGEEGAAGEDGAPGPPGPAGAAGAAGATGADGPMGAILMWEPDDPEEPMMIPGNQGPQGNPGATGAAGQGFPQFVADDPDTGDNDIMFPPGRTLPDFYAYRIFVAAAATTFNVNNTGYVVQIPFEFSVDLDYFPFTDFRLLISGNSNAAAQSVTLQLATFGAPSTPIHTGGDDLVVNNAGALYDSGWRSRDDGATGLKTYMFCTKGSNSTVDLSATYVEVLLRLRR